MCFQTSTRPNHQVGGTFANRRGHAPKLSISDPSHHVTETIGTLYDSEEEDAPQDGSQRRASTRPLSFMPSSNAEELPRASDTASDGRPQLDRSTSDSANLQVPGPGNLKKIHTSPARIPTLNGSYDSGPTSPISPTLSLKDVQDDPATSQFPLGNIEKPSDIAQELSNLQALRRMSMDVGNNNDPDMLPFSSLSLIPSIAPTGNDDEADPNRLLWVPARVHPELAPSEFQTFLETRVKTMKRRSGDSLLQPDEGLGRSDSGGLKRKKSMLSRQVDASDSGGRGYVDGADRLERRRSQLGRRESDLTLDELVKDPNRVVQRLAEESKLQEGQTTEDMPILPIAPGAGLRRSTRTTYRKGGSLRGAALSKRIASRHSKTESKDETETETQQPLDAPKGYGLNRTLSEPVSENTTRPSKPLRRPQKLSQGSNTLSDAPLGELPLKDAGDKAKASHRSFHIDGSGQLPQFGDTGSTPQDDDSASRPFPKRSSSQKASAEMAPQAETQQQQQPQPQPDQPPPKSRKRQGVPGRLSQSSLSQQETPARKATPEAGLNSGHIPVDGRDNNTDALTYIPTLSGEDKRPDKRKKDDDSSSTTSSKSGWNSWFKSGAGDKKKKDEEKKSKKGLVERAHDNVRLDVIQTSIGKTVSKGKDSLMPDRETDVVDQKPLEERKKETHRKTNSKKEKDGNFLTSLFSGGRRKSEKESGSGRKAHARQISEEPVYRPLRPNIDYPYTRFKMAEERAIYRMAHIKLANPRRPLQSQVLLSNFMYNYLAIVQAEHPQYQLPTSPQQKRIEEERRREEEQQQYQGEGEMQQGAQGDGIDRYTFDYHRVSFSHFFLEFHQRVANRC